MPDGEFCPNCGEKLFSKCPICGKDIPNCFSSPYLTTQHRPLKIPKVSDFCSECGNAFPWTKDFQSEIEKNGFWGLMHPRVVAVARTRFETGHYADSVEAVFKEINCEVKRLYLKKSGNEKDGVDLMFTAFSGKVPSIKLADLNEESGMNVQEGYKHIFAGSMQAIRNPSAHSNLDLI